MVVSITVNGLDEDLERRLRLRAAEQGVSVEQAARDILSAALCEDVPETIDLASSIRARFAPFGGVELELPDRDPIRGAPRF